MNGVLDGDSAGDRAEFRLPGRGNCAAGSLWPRTIGAVSGKFVPTRSGPRRSQRGSNVCSSVLSDDDMSRLSRTLPNVHRVFDRCAGLHRPAPRGLGGIPVSLPAWEGMQACRRIESCPAPRRKAGCPWESFPRARAGGGVSSCAPCRSTLAVDLRVFAREPRVKACQAR